MEDLPSDVRRAYHHLADDPKYQHFVRIPDRILQCIDYFGVACDHLTVRAKLHVYYLFIGVVDVVIDAGSVDAGKSILDYLRSPASLSDEEARGSGVKPVTEILKSNISDKIYPLMMDKLRQLYGKVVDEQGATSIDSYIEHRKSVGSLTAELSYILIQPDLSGEHEALGHFMKQVGAIGCLIDSFIDLSADSRFGLLGFKPGAMDYARLLTCILRDGLRISLKHFGLSGLFLRAIVDNVRDRFRADRNVGQPWFASDRKNEAASVA